ncbi:MAG: nuclear transport factor 2 family protein [Terriglobales bacterium]
MATLLRMSIALTLCLVTPAVIGFLWDKSPTSDSHEEIVELENRWLQAKDPKTLQAILADDFIHVLPAGFITKEEQIQYLTGNKNNDGEPRQFEDLRVRVFGNVAVTNGAVVERVANGKIRKTLFTDVFAFRDGKWQAVNAQETPLADSPAK